MSARVSHGEQTISCYPVANAPSTQPSPLQPYAGGGQQHNRSHSLGSCPCSHFSRPLSLTVFVHCTSLKYLQYSLATLLQSCCSQLKSATVSLKRRTPVPPALVQLKVHLPIPGAYNTAVPVPFSSVLQKGLMPL